MQSFIKFLAINVLRNINGDEKLDRKRTLKCSGCKIPHNLHMFGKPSPHCNATSSEGLPSLEDDSYPLQPDDVKGLANAKKPSLPDVHYLAYTAKIMKLSSRFI